MLPPAATGLGAPAFEIVSAGEELTVVVASAPFTGPVSLLLMLYVSLWRMVPFRSGELTRTTRVTLPDAPPARAPMFQVTTPPACVPGAEADTKVVLAGVVSLTTTFVAFALPVFVYDSV